MLQDTFRQDTFVLQSLVSTMDWSLWSLFSHVSHYVKSTSKVCVWGLLSANAVLLAATPPERTVNDRTTRRSYSEWARSVKQVTPRSSGKSEDDGAVTLLGSFGKETLQHDNEQMGGGGAESPPTHTASRNSCRPKWTILRDAWRTYRHIKMFLSNAIQESNAIMSKCQL